MSYTKTVEKIRRETVEKLYEYYIGEHTFIISPEDITDLVMYAFSAIHRATLEEVEEQWKEYFKRNAEQADTGTIIAVDAGLRTILSTLKEEI